MMTREQVMELLALAGDDIEVYEDDDQIDATVYDFAGFDEHWSEIERELDDPEQVDRIYEILREECLEYVDDFYQDFIFDGFRVHWGYASYDI